MFTSGISAVLVCFRLLLLRGLSDGSMTAAVVSIGAPLPLFVEGVQFGQAFFFLGFAR